MTIDPNDPNENRVDPMPVAGLILELIAGIIAMGNMSGCWFIHAW